MKKQMFFVLALFFAASTTQLFCADELSNLARQLKGLQTKLGSLKKALSSVFTKKPTPLKAHPSLPGLGAALQCLAQLEPLATFFQKVNPEAGGYRKQYKNVLIEYKKLQESLRAGKQLTLSKTLQDFEQNEVTDYSSWINKLIGKFQGINKGYLKNLTTKKFNEPFKDTLIHRLNLDKAGINEHEATLGKMISDEALKFDRAHDLLAFHIKRNKATAQAPLAIPFENFNIGPFLINNPYKDRHLYKLVGLVLKSNDHDYLALAQSAASKKWLSFSEVRSLGERGEGFIKDSAQAGKPFFLNQKTYYPETLFYKKVTIQEVSKHEKSPPGFINNKDICWLHSIAQILARIPEFNDLINTPNALVKSNINQKFRLDLYKKALAYIKNKNNWGASNQEYPDEQSATASGFGVDGFYTGGEVFKEIKAQLKNQNDYRRIEKLFGIKFLSSKNFKEDYEKRRPTDVSFKDKEIYQWALHHKTIERDKNKIREIILQEEIRDNPRFSSSVKISQLPKYLAIVEAVQSRIRTKINIKADNDKKINSTYELFGALVYNHRHWTSMAKAENNKWYWFNDAIVTEIENSHINGIKKENNDKSNIFYGWEFKVTFYRKISGGDGS